MPRRISTLVTRLAACCSCCLILGSLLLAPTPVEASIGCFFSYKLCDRDVSGAHKCYGNYIQNHHVYDIRGCHSYNLNHCDNNDGGYAKCTAPAHAMSPAPPALHPSSPITGPSKAWKSEHDLEKYTAVITSVGGAITEGTTSAALYVISPLVDFFTGSYGAKQCPNANESANADGTCTNWTQVWKNIENYVKSYVSYETELENAKTVKENLIYIYGEMQDIQNAIKHDAVKHISQSTDGFLLQKIRALDEAMERMRPDFQFLFDDTVMNDTEFVRQLRMGDHWAVVTAMPHFYSMHITVKVMNMWASPDHVQLVAHHIVNRAHEYNANVQSLYARLEKVRLAAMEQAPSYSYSKNNGRCFESEDHDVVGCDKDSSDRSDIDARPTEFETVTDNWPNCNWSKTTVKSYTAWDTTKSCMGPAHCDWGAGSGASDSTAAGCMNKHKEWVMSNWRTFWTRELVNVGTWAMDIAGLVDRYVLSAPAHAAAADNTAAQHDEELIHQVGNAVAHELTPEAVRNTVQQVKGFLRGSKNIAYE